MFKLVPLALGGGVAIAALVGVIALKNAEEAGLRETMAGQTACLTAAGGADPVASAASCPPAVAAQHRIARASVRCDRALLEADLFAVEAACSAEVKTLLSQRDAETVRADGLVGALARARTDQAAAVSRAEARARTQSQRTARGQAVVSSAPRDVDGLVVCDAGCLRERFADPE
jgi:hypothetical protein